MRFHSLLALLLFTAIPFMGISQPLDKAKLAGEVKAAYLHAWNGYKTYAWGTDALKPLSKQGHNWYPKTLLMTPVDAYDGLLLMGLKDEAAEAKKLILDNLRFDMDMRVQNFEVSIRILGGLLSAYEMDGDKRFLDLAKDLGDRLLKAFNSPTGMPYRYINLKTGAVDGKVSNPAEIGTYLVEFGILSRHTGDQKYYRTAMKAMRALYAIRSALDLTPEGVDVETGKATSTESHISGGIDSYLEYMLKGAILFNDNELSDMWNTSHAAVNKYLLDDSPRGFWYGRADMNTGQRTQTYYGALDAFFAGSLVLANETGRAASLQSSNYVMWMLQGIEPECIDYSTMKIITPNYSLRPENIEGAYYLYRATGNERFLEMGKTMFENIVKYCKADDGFCALKSVISKEKDDYMESFFLAETLKYAFLLFDDNRALDFSKVIFGTEAHPYKK